MSTALGFLLAMGIGVLSSLALHFGRRAIGWLFHGKVDRQALLAAVDEAS